MDVICRVSRKAYFSAAHNLEIKHLSPEENQKIFGSRYSPHGYGHNYVLDATITGPITEHGMILDLKILDSMMKAVTDNLDHRYLNLDVPYFTDHLPTLENVGKYCFLEIQKQIQSELQNKGISLQRIRLYESPDYWVDVYAD